MILDVIDKKCPRSGSSRPCIFALQTPRVIEKPVFNFKPFSACLENNLHRIHTGVSASFKTRREFFFLSFFFFLSLFLSFFLSFLLAKQNGVVYENRKRKGKKGERERERERERKEKKAREKRERKKKGWILCILRLGFKKHGNPFPLAAVATVFNYRQSSE